jgi:hypothetical protein
MPAGIVFDEQTRVLWFAEEDTPVSLASIHTGDIADAVDLTGYIAPDGLAFGATEARVDGGDLLDGYDSQSMGRYGDQPALTLKRKLRDGGEVAWTTFATRRQQGTLVVFLGIDVGANPGLGDTYVAYPQCENGTRMLQNSAANAEVKFIVNFAVGEKPVYGTVITGS